MPDQIQLNDGVSTGGLYSGNGDGAGAGGATLTLLMDLIGEASGSQVLLTASAETGIVAVDDGGTWAGATDLVLPFP